MSEPPIDRRYEDAAERQALEADNERLREAIYWALGERDEFPEEPPPLNGKWRQRYWWRRELRRRAFDVDDNGADQPRPLTSDERAALDRAFERSITVIHPGIDATGDQPVICTHDGSAVPDDSGGWFCADCGYVSGADQPSDDSALTPGDEWWMDVAGVPVKLDEWQPGAMKRSATDNGEAGP